MILHIYKEAERFQYGGNFFSLVLKSQKETLRNVWDYALPGM